MEDEDITDMVIDSRDVEELTADEMFEKLGYKRTEEVIDDLYNNGIQYTKRDKDIKKCIEFYYYHKEILTYTEQAIENEITRWKIATLNLKELKAINKKVKELGWVDE